MIGFDAGHLKAKGNSNDKYVVIQVVLTEKFIGTGSGISSLTNLQATINEQTSYNFYSCIWLKRFLWWRQNSSYNDFWKNRLISKNGDVL